MSIHKAEELRFIDPNYYRRKQLVTDSDAELNWLLKQLRRKLTSRQEALERSKAIIAIVEAELARRNPNDAPIQEHTN